MGNVCECLFPREEPQANHNSHAAPTKTTESVPIPSSVENDAAVVLQPVDGKGVDVRGEPISWSSPVFSPWGSTGQEQEKKVETNQPFYPQPMPPSPPPSPIPPPIPPPPKEVDDPYSGNPKAKPSKRIPGLGMNEPYVDNDEKDRVVGESSDNRSGSNQASHSEDEADPKLFVPEASKPVAPFLDVPKPPQSEEQDVDEDGNDTNPFKLPQNEHAAPFLDSPKPPQSQKQDVDEDRNDTNPFKLPQNKHAAPFPDSPHSSKSQKGNGHGVDVGSNPFKLPQNKHAEPFPDSPRSSRSTKHRTSSRLRNPFGFKRDSKLSSLAV